MGQMAECPTGGWHPRGQEGLEAGGVRAGMTDVTTPVCKNWIPREGFFLQTLVSATRGRGPQKATVGPTVTSRGSRVHRARLTLSRKAVMSHSSASRLEPRFSAAMNCSRFSCFMPGVLKISRSLCHHCLS